MEIMTDNWLLEEVTKLFGDGLSKENDRRLSVNAQENYYEYSKVVKAEIQIETLFSLLLNIVLREKLVVDNRYAIGWRDSTKAEEALGPLKHLADKGVIDVRDFQPKWDELSDLRTRIIDKLCVTDDLFSITQANIEQYKQKRQNVDSHMSISLIGGAGMLARASLLDTIYVGHPHRQRLFQQAGLFSSKPDTVNDVIKDIDDVRSTMVKFSSASMSGQQLQIHAPAIAIEIIQDSNSVDDIFRVAVEYRAKYRRLRQWLATYQEALDTEELGTSVKMRSFLKSYLSDAQVSLDLQEGSSTGISVSAAWFQFPLPSKPLKQLRNSFGLRSDFSRLLLKGTGEAAIKKLLKIFGEDGTAFARDVEASILAGSV